MHNIQAHKRKPKGTHPHAIWWLLLGLILLFALTSEWGCYGEIPGRFKPDGALVTAEAATESPTKETPPTPDASVNEPAPRQEPPAPDTSTTPDPTPQDTTPDQPAAPDAVSDTAPDQAIAPDKPAPGDDPQPPELPQDRGTPPTNRCLQKKPPAATGATLTLAPGKKLSELLAQAKDGDLISVKQGTYPYESLKDIKFTKYVLIKAEAGAKPIIEGFDCQNCAYLSFQGIHIRNKTLGFRDCHHIWLDNLDVDLETNAASGIQIVGSGSGPTSHHYEIHNSRISGGQRTIFIRTNFSVDTNWNYDINVTYNTIECGTNNCFQLSGARDMLIQNNQIKTKLGGTGILLAGATRIEIRRNHVIGVLNHAKSGSGMNIATPGKEWDNFKNVKYMITSHVTIANNLVADWNGIGIALNGTRHIDIFNNTIYTNKNEALRLIRRTPHDFDGNLILTGNTDLRLWNNIFNKISLDAMESRPTLESNNLVEGTGGGGSNLIKAAPMFMGANDFRLKPGSPAIDKGLVNTETPKFDLHNTPRDSKPDLGAIEADSQAATCP